MKRTDPDNFFGVKNFHRNKEDMMKCDEKHQEQIRIHIIMQKRFGEECRLLHICSWIAINAQCRDVCVGVQMRQLIEQPFKCQGNKLWSQTTNPHPTETTQPVTKARHAFGPLLHHPHLPWVPRPMVLHVSPPPSWADRGSSPPMPIMDLGCQMLPHYPVIWWRLGFFGSNKPIKYRLYLCHPWFRITYSPHSVTLADSVSLWKMACNNKNKLPFGMASSGGLCIFFGMYLGLWSTLLYCLKEIYRQQKMPLCPLWAH